jgi:hypothetical protein
MDDWAAEWARARVTNSDEEAAAGIRAAYARARREALEAAAQAMCGGCFAGTPRDGHGNHVQSATHVTQCNAAPIRALMDRAPGEEE